MQYPYRVIADGIDVGPFVAYHRTPESAENAVIHLLRAGVAQVSVNYLRRPLVTFVNPGTGPLPDDRSCYISPEILLTGDAAMLARHDAWVAAGSRTDAAGNPILERIDPPISKRIKEDVARLGAAPALPRGKARRAVYELLMAAGLPEDAAGRTLAAINGYLK